MTYDEHGGFYDHVKPPEAVPPGDPISDEDNNHHNFSFARLGVRVPASIYHYRGLIEGIFGAEETKRQSDLLQIQIKE